MVKMTCFRFNLDNPEHAKAWKYIHDVDKKKMKSGNTSVIKAINEYFDRMQKLTDDPYFETRQREERFVEQIVSEVGRAATGGERSKMPNRKRYHSISLKLTDEEFQLWNTKHQASGLSKTDYLMQTLRESEVHIYSIEASIAPLVHEIRKIGTNLNQLAYFFNLGQDERVQAEIGAIRKANDEVMGKISDFLSNPKFRVK